VKTASLTAATLAVAGIGFLGLGILILFVDETLHTTKREPDPASDQPTN
jgi:uncharacterized protein involved in exopolysaccharide biosynthesis